jgi:predicted nuclease with TOPRIM domain
MAQVDQQINISMADILGQVHGKYGKLIQGLLQENAELQAGVEVLGPRCQELEQENAVLREQYNSLSAPAAQDQPGGVGLLSANGQAFIPGT